MNSMNKIVKKINTKVAKSMPGISVKKGWFGKFQGEDVFKMIAKTPYGKVQGICFIESIKDKLDIVKIISDALVYEIKDYQKHEKARRESK